MSKDTEKVVKSHQQMIEELKELAKHLEGFMDTQLNLAKTAALEAMYYRGQKQGEEAIVRFERTFTSYLNDQSALRRVNMILGEPYEHLDHMPWEFYCGGCRPASKGLYS